MEDPWPSPVEFEAASKLIAAWTPDAMPRRIRNEKRTIRAPRKNECPSNFTECRVGALLGALFWQGFFVMFIKVRGNKLSQPFNIG
jgi:hypothetical protein